MKRPSAARTSVLVLIPLGVAERAMGRTAFATWSRLVDLADCNGIVRASTKRIANGTGLTLKQVSNSLYRLRELRLVTKPKRKGNTWVRIVYGEHAGHHHIKVPNKVRRNLKLARTKQAKLLHNPKRGKRSNAFREKESDVQELQPVTRGAQVVKNNADTINDVAFSEKPNSCEGLHAVDSSAFLGTTKKLTQLHDIAEESIQKHFEAPIVSNVNLKGRGDEISANGLEAIHELDQGLNPPSQVVPPLTKLRVLALPFGKGSDNPRAREKLAKTRVPSRGGGPPLQPPQRSRGGGPQDLTAEMDLGQHLGASLSAKPPSSPIQPITPPYPAQAPFDLKAALREPLSVDPQTIPAGIRGETLIRLKHPVVPPYPWDVLRPAQTPRPPHVPMQTFEAVRFLQKTHNTLVRSLWDADALKQYGLPHTHGRIGKALEKTAAALREHDLQPAVWGLWKMEYLKDHNRPVYWRAIWSPAAIHKQRGWCRSAMSGHMRLVAKRLHPPQLLALLNKHSAMLKDLRLAQTQADVRRVVAEHFPGDTYRVRVQQAQQEVTMREAELTHRAERGAFVW